MTAHGESGAAGKVLRRVVDVRPGEARAVLVSCAYFFSLLCGYYLLRPLREEMGIRGGIGKLHWVFTATFVAMVAAVPLYSALIARVPRARAIPLVYRFFLSNLAVFWALLHFGIAPEWTARAFFVWISVYNLFVVSVFWSFMADLFSSEQGKRVFGFVAAGGSAGALAGPALAALLVTSGGVSNLVLLSALLLEVSAQLAASLARDARRAATPAAGRLDRSVGGGPFAGFALVFRSRYLFALALQTLFVTVTSTFLYFQQAQIVASALTDSARRTQLFAVVDLSVNVLALLLQAFATGAIITYAGIAVALVLHPAITAAGLVAVAAAPTLVVITAVQAIRRAVHYAVERPAREVLFTVVDGEQKYKAKSFIDTVVYRGGDAISAWTQSALRGFGLAATAALALPISVAWIAVVVWLARRQRAAEIAQQEAA
ncbi:MAG TPA: MFS transporter [Anaeromyxobacteraceae bacterium]|nr:MFS transporter [Anaeromyxobacteraceae bacterium]